MSRQPLRIGAIGAGRVLQRLYLPALACVPGLRLVAAADPSPLARDLLPGSVQCWLTAEELVAARMCDALLVLSSGGLHADHAALALRQGIPVLLEKPSANSLAELEAWPEPWRALLTPARPRRYWPRYLSIRHQIEPGQSFDLALQTSPAGWGATHEALPADDLLPHLLDLAEWLSRTPVDRIAASTGEVGGRGTFVMADGRVVGWRIRHADTYEESVRCGDLVIRLDAVSFPKRLVKRLLGTPAQDVQGTARMLRLWERRLRGETIGALPGFETAVRETRIREQLQCAGRP